MIDVTSVIGYGEMSVEDIITTAGVSRRTFYDLFDNKHQVFLACFDRVAGGLRERIQQAYDAGTNPFERVVGCIEALTSYISEDPARAELGIVEVMAAGQDGITRRNETIAYLAGLVREGTSELPGASSVPEVTSETIVGGLYEVLYSRVVRGETDELPQLVPDLVQAVVLPYLGLEGAQAVRARVLRDRTS